MKNIPPTKAFLIALSRVRIAPRPRANMEPQPQLTYDGSLGFPLSLDSILAPALSRPGRLDFRYRSNRGPLSRLKKAFPLQDVEQDEYRYTLIHCVEPVVLPSGVARPLGRPLAGAARRGVCFLFTFSTQIMADTPEPTPSAPDKKSNGNSPLFRLHDSGCFATVFANSRIEDGQTVNRYRVTLHRRQPMKDGGFETKYSFRFDDLERLTQMLFDAKEQIIEHQQGMPQADSPGSQAE